MRLVLLLLLLVAACGRGPRLRPGSTPATVLRVDNRNFRDMVVYSVNSGQRIRLGLATGLSLTDLRIPPHALGGSRELAFMADPVGSSRTAYSESIYVVPGDTVSLMIPP